MVNIGKVPLLGIIYLTICLLAGTEPLYSQSPAIDLSPQASVTATTFQASQASVLNVSSTLNFFSGSSLELGVDSDGNVSSLHLDNQGQVNFQTTGDGVALLLNAGDYEFQNGDSFTLFTGRTDRISGSLVTHLLPALADGLHWDTSRLNEKGGWVLSVTTGKPGALQLFMSPNGNDINNGLSAVSPVKTLGRIQEILQDLQPQSDVRVNIEPGHYYGQTVVWRYVNPDYRITFAPPENALDRPVFDGKLEDGSYPGGTWFQLIYSSGTSTNLDFYRLRVQNYHTAISFNGNRNSDTGFNGNNRIEKCYFYRIGNVYNPSLGTSTAVIRFVNSKNNTVINNDFIDAINVTGGALLHAIYAAHMSDFNTISQNRFINHSGDPVRIRDYSNWNYVSDNIHIRAGAYGYSEWYCNNDERDDCTKPTPECSSWYNQYRDNYLVSNYYGGNLSTFTYFQPATTTGCAPPDDNAVRLSTSGNVRPNSSAVFTDYVLWQHAHFTAAERTDPATSGMDATPANDGIPNRIKLAMGLDPKTAYSPADLARPVVANNQYSITYSRNTALSGYIMQIQISEDLKNWTTATSNELETLSIQPNPEGTREQITVRLKDEMNQADTRFIRFHIQFDAPPGYAW